MTRDTRNTPRTAVVIDVVEPAASSKIASMKPRRRRSITTSKKLALEVRVANLIAENWYQISRYWRTVARLPKDKTGKEALALHNKHLAQILHEDEAIGYYLRVYAERDGNWQELDPTTFTAFRHAGGRAAPLPWAASLRVGKEK